MYGDVASLLLVSVCICAGADDVIVFLTTQQGSEPGKIQTISMTSDANNILHGFKMLKPEALVYDVWTDRIYWTDVKTKEIRSARSDGSNEQHVFDFDTKAIPEGLALDPVSRQLFYTDTGNDKIGSVSLENTQQSKIIVDGHNVKKPRGIAIHSQKGLIIWTDWKAWAVIEVATISGQDRRSLVKTDLSWPNAVTVDEISDIVYWCDAYTTTIESIHIDGTHRALLLKEPNTHYYGTFLFENTLYVSDWKTSILTVLSVNGSDVITYTQIHGRRFANISNPFAARVSRCPDGTYGENCTECGKCKGGEMCNKLTGQCLHGCEPGYVDSCNNGSCDDIFGHNVSMCDQIICYCQDNAGCPDNVCPNGCQAGWNGTSCNKECPKRTFGVNCEENCGHCAGADTCDRFNGRCEYGCKEGWEGSNCNASTTRIDIEDDSESSTTVSGKTTTVTTETDKTSGTSNKFAIARSTSLGAVSDKGSGVSSRLLAASTITLGIMVVVQTIMLMRMRRRRNSWSPEKSISSSGSYSTSPDITCLGRVDKICQTTDFEVLCCGGEDDDSDDSGSKHPIL